MKKLTVNGINYGPYNEVAVEADRYICDGAHLPFSVVGQGAISDVVEGDFAPIVAPIEVPKSITASQARRALNASSLRQTVEDAVALADQDIKDYWEYETVLNRNHPVLLAMAQAINLTDEQLDELFILGATL